METRFKEDRYQTTNGNSLTTLIRELRDETITLVRQEVALAKAELTEKVSRLTRNAVSLALGGVLALGAFGLLLLALRDLLGVGLVAMGVSQAVAIWLSPLILAIVIGGIGAALIVKAKNAMAAEGIAPQKTIETLREDKDWAKNRLQKTT